VNGLSALKNRGRILAGGLLLAAFTTGAAVGGPAAVAAPSSAAVPSHLAHQADRHSLAKGKPAPVDVSWSEIPAGATEPDSRVRFSYTNIKPGSVIKDYVAIINRGKVNAAFSVYGTDATGTTTTDALTFLIAGAKPKDIGSWVQFLPSKATQLSLLIPGGHGVIEPFTINVPTFATPGDHTGGMVAQVGVLSSNGRGQQVIEYQRIVVPIELRVTGPLHSGLQIQSISTSFNDPVNPFGTGSATISYSVFNSGNVRITGTQLLKVTGLFGMSSTVRPPSLPVILPGDSVRITTTLPGLYPAGLLEAHVTITPGWPKTALPLPLPLTQATNSASLFAFPWAFFGMILLLAAAGFGTWRFLRWRSREHQADMAAVAERARRETERRLLGSRKHAATVGGRPAPTATDGTATSTEAGGTGPDSAGTSE
jgi:hypothetical protein